MNNDGTWKFASNGNAIEYGLNDAGIETFAAHRVESTIRETIQNVIDQRSEVAAIANLPVIVEFSDFEIKQNDFPNNMQFKEVLDKCIVSAENGSVRKIFEQAKSDLSNPIKVLRISDYNTTGLIGAESGKRGTPWHNLIKANGSSNKHMTSGGSYGIGKSAPFACSSLRTVIYASKVNNIYSYVGVARLISHEENGVTTIGTGFYSDSNKLTAILKPFSLNGFRRKENGTDIYIMGFDGNGNLKQQIIETVAYNFFISIFNNILVVKYNDIIINKDTIGDIVSHLDDKKYADLKIYYNMLNEMLQKEPSPDNTELKKIYLNCAEYGQEFDIKDGECTLLLQKGDDLNRRILMSRKIGMTLFLQSGFNSGISFTGILLITGNNMNNIFKEMEMPAHDAWEPNKCKIDREKHIKAYEQLRKYLRDKVQLCFGETRSESIVAYGMEEFFSDYDDDAGDVKVEIAAGKPEASLMREKRSSIKRDKIYVSNDSRELAEEEFAQTQYSTNPNTNPVPNQTQKPNHPTFTLDLPTSTDDQETMKSISLNYKFINDMKKRLLRKDTSACEYRLKFKIDKKIKHLKLEFVVLGEKDSYPINITNVSITSTKKISEYLYNTRFILLQDVYGKNEIEINFKINYTGDCMMGVNCYEA